MANRYVRSTDGSDADDASTWALAKATIAGLDAIDTAGDYLYVSQSHAETTGAAVSWSFAGTEASPTKLVCANDGAEPPTTLANTATATTNAASSGFTFSGNCYVHGISFTAGSGQSTTCSILQSQASSTIQTFNQCKFILASTGVSSRIQASLSSAINPVQTIWNDCDVKFAASGQGIQVGEGEFQWRGGSLLSGGTSPTSLFVTAAGSQRGGKCTIDGVDLSNAGTGITIFGSVAAPTVAKIRNCKLPASWSGTLTTGTLYPGQRYEMINCDAGDTHYRIWVQAYWGTIKSEATLVRTGSPTNGADNISWQMVSVANTEYPHQTLESPEIIAWNDTVGSSVTATLHVLHDSATNLKDNDIWIEVMYCGTSGAPLGSYTRDSVAVLGAAADQASDAGETWTTTGMTNPNKQKLNVSFTPQEVGWVVARVHLALASKTVYVDPVLELA
ncbi:MAG: hypothetical protein HY749_16245 [Gammaproteobacteria bacterium]|nr:hypothetical protein [Gammaproteobacteria bacterium]